MLTPFDDYPIHPSADPIAHPATGDINHYDRYWFNGHHREGAFYFGAAMGHYPVRGVIDAAFSIVRDGVEHSIFAAGAMPTDRSTTIGPIRIEVAEPMRTIRYVVEPNEHGIECDLTFRATTVAVEEPRQQRRTTEGILLTDHTRLTQWGTWQGTISVDGDELLIEPTEVSGTRDRSWGIRPIGEQVQVIREPMPSRCSGSGRHCISAIASLIWHCTSMKTADGGSRPPSSLIPSPMTQCRGAEPASANVTASATNSSGSPGAERSNGRDYGSMTPMRARSTSKSRWCSPSACAASATGTHTGVTEASTVRSRPGVSRSGWTTSIPPTSLPSTSKTSLLRRWVTAAAWASSSKSPSDPINRAD